MTITRVGVTGTRHELSEPQARALERLLLAMYDNAIPCGPLDSFELHHGCCTGADEAAHGAMSGLRDVRLIGHPGRDRYGSRPFSMPEAVMLTTLHECYPSEPYAVRNAAIVASIERLIAVPAYVEAHPRSKRSGTWQTVRLARQAGKPVTHVWPDGSIASEVAR